jgi:hypothetical protein
MALKQADKDKIQSFGFDVDKLLEAIKADAEVDYAVPSDVTVIKTTELEARDANNKNIGKTEGEAIGEKKGKELSAKAFKKKFGLEETIPADIDKVVEAVNTKLNKGDTGLQEQISLLQKDKEALLTEKTQLEAKVTAAGFDAELISYFPANRTPDLSDAERLALVKMNMSFETVEGKTLVKRNGEVVRNATTKDPLPVKEAIGSLFTEKKWIGGEGGAGGRGAGDNPPPPGSGAGIKTASKFKEKWVAENPGKNELSDEYISALNKQAKEVADFDMYN